MELNRAIEEAINGNAILFTGAGFSKGAKNIDKSSIMSGVELAEFLCKQCEMSESLDLDEASDCYIEKFDEDLLIDYLKKKYTITKVSNAHSVIAKINWKRIYTTNYDNIMELAYGNLSKKLVPVIMDDNIRATNLNSNICIHLNGYIDRLDRDSLKSGFKLTNTSYLTDAFLSSPWIHLFRDDLRIAKAAFFIGYSLYDLDIRRILYQLKHLQEKCFFITKPNPSASLTLRLNKFGKIVPEGTKVFSKTVSTVLASYVPVELDEIPYTSFDNFSDPIDFAEEFRDEHIFQLLLTGNRNHNFVRQSITNEGFSPYYILRKEVDDVLQAIQSGTKNILLYSELGNGKTLLLDGIRSKARQNGMKVFTLIDRNQHTDYELDNIIKNNCPVLLIIENYHNELDLIEQIQLKKPNNFFILLTSRSSVNDVFFDRLLSILNSEDILEFDVNCLSTSEVDKFVHLLDHYGLWGANAGLDFMKKKTYISHKCKSEFQGVLIDIIRSPDIHKRLVDIFRLLDQRNEFYKIIIATFALEAMGYAPKIDIIMQLLNTNAINSSVFRRNQTVKQLIDFNTDEIIIRSSILAQYILTNVSDGNLVIDTLIEMTTNSESLYSFRKSYSNIFRDLMQYSTIQAIVPDKNKRPNIIRYYESLKNLEHAATNPFFWLQYAIARLFFKEYDKAKVYFATAYSYAKRRSRFNTFQIDNHFARYLLETAMFNDDLKTCMIGFREAHQIVMRQVRDEKKHYPYRVATKYHDFCKQYFAKLGTIDQKFLLKAATYVLEHIDRLPQQRRQNRYVVECKEKLQSIISECT